MGRTDYLAFSQQLDVTPDEFTIILKARTYFDATLAFVDKQFGGGGQGAWAKLTIDYSGKNDTNAVSFQARVRFCRPDDYAAADEAERRGRAGGMAALARRCRIVWELDPSGNPEALVLRLCALLAASLLGPILPPGGATLFGVRSARERADALDKA